MDFSASHYSGCGNDFLIVDDREGRLPALSQEAIWKVCASKSFVDGLIIIRRSTICDVRMHYYNCDGKEAELCGNGARCLLRFLQQRQAWKPSSCTVEIPYGTIVLRQENEDVIVSMPQPSILQWNISLPFLGKEWVLHHIDTGVPHLVTFVDDVEIVDVNTVGRFFRSHPLFMPKGTNVNFVQYTIDKPSLIRTFERGVETETLACGTGACAAAIALYKLHGILSPIVLQVRSKELLEIGFHTDNEAISNLELKGSARWIKDYTIRF